MYICININSRVTELYHTLRRQEEAPWSKNTKMKRIHEQSLVKKNQMGGHQVKDCQSSLELKNKQTEKKKTHPGNTSHTLWHSHTLQRTATLIIKLFFFLLFFLLFKGAVRSGRCELAMQWRRGVRKVEGHLFFKKDVWTG